jgi:hypothetical protein
MVVKLAKMSKVGYKSRATRLGRAAFEATNPPHPRADFAHLHPHPFNLHLLHRCVAPTNDPNIGGAPESGLFILVAPDPLEIPLLKRELDVAVRSSGIDPTGKM